MIRIKKILALTLAVLMLMNLTACGGNSDPAGETTDPAVPNVSNEATNETAPTTGNATETDETLTVHENTFFTVRYKEADGWSLMRAADLPTCGSRTRMVIPGSWCTSKPMKRVPLPSAKHCMPTVWI